MPITHETDATEHDLPGRHLRELLFGLRHSSGREEKVRPVHSHPPGEEVIYIIHGSGRVLVAGEVVPVREGCVVLSPKGAIHMLRNTGTEEMKVICFFAPSTGLANYEMHEEVDFPLGP